MKIGFTSSKTDFISRTIQYFTKNNAQVFPVPSHAFFLIQEDESKPISQFALSSDEFITDIIDVDVYRNPDRNLRIYEIPDIIPMDEWIKSFVSRFNKRTYGWFDLLWFPYKLIRQKINPAWRGSNPIKSGIICSELVTLALIDAGYYEYVKDISINSIDPVELENIVASLPGVKLIENNI